MSDMITLADLERALRLAGKNCDRVIAPVVKATAMKVRETQRANVPVGRTKRTRDSIKATGPNGAPFTRDIIEAEIGPTWFVGRLIETGTVKMAPRVFVANSLDPHLAAHQNNVLNAVAKSIFE